MGDCTVAVNFFKGNFPLVMAFFTVHGYHRVECAFFEAELARVLFSLLQMLVAVDQQVA
ncbi:hypothetical protein D3C80_2081100 [compost metagenome]